jgi:hypothetical protein
MESETGLQIFDLTRFLDANRFPPPDQVRGRASLENALTGSRTGKTAPGRRRPAKSRAKPEIKPEMQASNFPKTLDISALSAERL